MLKTHNSSNFRSPIPYRRITRPAFQEHLQFLFSGDFLFALFGTASSFFRRFPCRGLLDTLLGFLEAVLNSSSQYSSSSTFPFPVRFETWESFHSVHPSRRKFNQLPSLLEAWRRRKSI